MGSLTTKAANPRWGNISQPYDDTFVWVWKEKSEGGPGFVKWLRSPSGIFWITGKPGAGKSTLMKYICKSSKTMKLLSDCTHLSRILQASYFFHAQGHSSETSWSGLLHALLRQLLSKIKSIPKEIEQRYHELQYTSIGGDGKLSWPEDELWEAINVLLHRQTDYDIVIIFIDGFDEYEGKDYGYRLDRLKTLLAPSLERGTLVKICIASRPLVEIEMRQTPTSYGLKIHEWTDNDISRYVAARLNETKALPYWTRHGRSLDIEQKIGNFTEIIVRKAFGVFIWVTVVVNNLTCGLEAGDTECELLEELEKLPSELEDLYDNIFRRIKLVKTEYLAETINYLRIVMMAKHRRTFWPLTLLELGLAAEGVDKAMESPSCPMLLTEKRVIAQNTKQRLESRCRGLLHATTQALDVDGDSSSGSDCDTDSGGSDADPDSYSSSAVETDKLGGLSGTNSSFHPLTVGPRTLTGADAGYTEVFSKKVELLHLTLYEYLAKRLSIIRRDINPKFIKDPDVCLMGLGLRLLKSDPLADGRAGRRRFQCCLTHTNRAEISTGQSQTGFIYIVKTLFHEKYMYLAGVCECSRRNNTSFMHLVMDYSLVCYIKEEYRKHNTHLIDFVRFFPFDTPEPAEGYGNRTWVSSTRHQDINHTPHLSDKSLLMIRTLLDLGIPINEKVTRGLVCPRCCGVENKPKTLWEAFLANVYLAEEYLGQLAPQESSELQQVLLRCLNRGADPNVYLMGWRQNAPMIFSGTPLHIVLLLRPSDVTHAKNRNRKPGWIWSDEGLTPPMQHFLRGFIRHGADPTIKNEDGHSALDFAKRCDEQCDLGLSIKKFLLDEREKYLEQQASSVSEPAEKRAKMAIPTRRKRKRDSLPATNSGTSESS